MGGVVGVCGEVRRWADGLGAGAGMGRACGAAVYVMYGFGPLFLVCAAACLRPYAAGGAAQLWPSGAVGSRLKLFSKRIEIIPWMLKFLSGL